MSPDFRLMPDPEIRAQVARARVDNDERYLAMAEAAAVGFERMEALSRHVAGLRLSEDSEWSVPLAVEITAADAALHAEALRTEAVYGPLRDRPSNLEGFDRDCYSRGVTPPSVDAESAEVLAVLLERAEGRRATVQGRETRAEFDEVLA